MKKILPLLTVMALLAGCGQTTPTTPTGVTNTNQLSQVQQNPLQDKPQMVGAFQTAFQLSADKMSVKVGDTVTVSILLMKAQESVTTANTVLSFDKSGLQVSKLDDSSSAFPLNFESSFDNAAGTVTVKRSHSKGVTGDNVELAKVVFKAVKNGSVTLRLNPNQTAVLLRNGSDVSPDPAQAATLQLTLTK